MILITVYMLATLNINIQIKIIFQDLDSYIYYCWLNISGTPAWKWLKQSISPTHIHSLHLYSLCVYPVVVLGPTWNICLTSPCPWISHICSVTKSSHIAFQTRLPFVPTIFVLVGPGASSATQNDGLPLHSYPQAHELKPICFAHLRMMLSPEIIIRTCPSSA